MKKTARFVAATMLGMFSLASEAIPVAYQGTLDIYDQINIDSYETVAITGSIDFDAMSMTGNPFVLMGVTGYFTSINLYGPGSYVFNVDSQVLGDPTSPGQTGMTVGAGQIGAFGLFDWHVTTDMGAVFVWDVSGDVYTGLTLTATDPDGDGILGTPQVDGPFMGISAAINLTADPAPVPAIPVPAAIWLFSSGLLALFGFVGCKKEKHGYGRV